jgi:TRAP-type uncharacterized transport system substrate-binding protein
MKLNQRINPILFLIVFILSISEGQITAQEDIDVGQTGWGVRRPVMAGACEIGCPWGELADYVQEAMEPYGYSVIICRNCNRNYGPRLVSENDFPPPLDEVNLHDGVNTRINARVDFGVTSSAMLSSAYKGRDGGVGGYKNLRLIAKIEDPFYFLIAFKKELGVTGFQQIKQQKLPVRLMGMDGNMRTVLNYYGISMQDIESWGGRTGVSVEEAVQGEFDVISGFLASPALNPESAYWTTISQKFDLYFVELPEELLQTLADQNVDAEIVEAQNSLLKGVNRRIKTLGRSGESVFARDDTPDEVAYDLAKAIDENHGALKWFIRIYTYDPKTVWQNFGVPLHPGAEKYYQEVGYMKD